MIKCCCQSERGFHLDAWCRYTRRMGDILIMRRDLRISFIRSIKFRPHQMSASLLWMRGKYYKHDISIHKLPDPNTAHNCNFLQMPLATNNFPIAKVYGPTENISQFLFGKIIILNFRQNTSCEFSKQKKKNIYTYIYKCTLRSHNSIHIQFVIKTRYKG